MDCFHEGPNFLVIDPDECIDCTLCEPECPVEAIHAEDDVPDNQQEYIWEKEIGVHGEFTLAVCDLDRDGIDEILLYGGGIEIFKKIDK